MSRFELGVVVLVVIAWLPGLSILAEAWTASEFATHGFLVPFVALWAATAQREAMASLPRRPIAVGRILLVICALAYLVFMIPLPPAWVTPLIVELQLIVSSAAVRLLQGFSVAILREDNMLTLPGGVSLFVADACSGITSLITLVPISVFIAYFTESGFLRRLALVVAVLPIALAGNLARVVLTVLLAIRVDVEFAVKGPLHAWAGVASYVVGCLCLIGLGRLLRRFWPESGRALSP